MQSMETMQANKKRKVREKIMAKTSVYQMVTDRIIAELEKGEIPWQKPWMNVYGNTEMQGAFNRVTKKSYSMLNQMLLSHEGEYASFKQWKALGGKIKKGAKSEIVVFWKILEVEDTNEDGETEKKKIPMLRYYNVFHISQVEGVEPLPKPGKIGDFAENSDAMADRIIKDYVEREGIDYRETESDSAYYMPSKDMVVVPCKEQFECGNKFYSTAFHELVHSTGNAKRLARIEKTAAFGNSEYSKEELVAELGAASILNMLGMETPDTFENSTAYIQNWLTVLRNDNRFIVSASSRAEKAVEYILGENQPKKEEPKEENAEAEKAEVDSTETTESVEGKPSTQTETETTKKVTERKQTKKEIREKERMEKDMKNYETILSAINNGNVAKAIEYLEENIRETSAKQAGNRQKDITLIKKITKEGNGIGSNKLFGMANDFEFDGMTMHGFLDGHRILASTADFGYKSAKEEEKFKLGQMFDDVRYGKYEHMMKIEVDRVALMAKKNLNKTMGKNGKYQPFIIKTDKGYIGINAEYLLDALDFCENDTIYLYADRWSGGKYKDPLFCIDTENHNDENKIALTLPVNVNIEKIESLETQVDQNATTEAVA